MRPLVFILFGLFAAPLAAALLQGFTFEHQDWEIACDNTGTCRAAGYGKKMGEISVLLTRKAGADQSVSGVVILAQTGQEGGGDITVSLRIDGTDKGELISADNGHFILNHMQIRELVKALTHSGTVVFTAGAQHKMLSDAGAIEVLQKMDAFQQRTGTAKALINTGTGSEASVMPAILRPEIIAAPVITQAKSQLLTARQWKKLAPKLTPTLNNDCEREANPAISSRDRQLTLTPIDKKTSIISALCWRSAYNEGYAIWVIDNTMNTPPRRITTDASYYADGIITQLHKGRGMADCMSGQEWVWQGKDFILAQTYTTGMCREIAAGGPWWLPTRVSNLQHRQEIDADNEALKILYNAVMQEKVLRSELDMSKLVKHFPVKHQTTRFTITYNETQDLPATKPSPEISDDEWQAFIQSPILADTENNQVNYTLVDLNNDGKRDLIINSYVGGIGLFSYTGVLKRAKSDFSAIASEPEEEMAPGIAGALFSENGHGANQWGTWIEINGQIYALWFNGVFGEDNLYLMRPFRLRDKVPALTIRYHYQFNAIDTDDTHIFGGEKSPAAFDERDKQRLLKALDTMQQKRLKAQSQSEENHTVCKSKNNPASEQPGQSQSAIAIHYTYEHVAQIPVWINQTCFIGTVISRYGAYHNGVDADIVVNSTDKEGDIVGNYTLSGRREIDAVIRSWRLRAGDRGVM